MAQSFEHFYRNFTNDRIITVRSRLAGSLKFYPPDAAETA